MIKINDFNGQKSLWFHCASVGEVRSIKTIIDIIRQHHPDYSIIVSTITTTGRGVAKDFLKADKVFLLPIENFNAIGKIIEYMNVSALVIVDTEIWPNLIYSASSVIPVFLINARISDKTFKKYKLFSFIFRHVLNRFTCIMTKSKIDEERFVSIMKNRKKIITAGNIKFQNRKDIKEVKTAVELKNVKYFLVASTHDGEEEEIFSWFDKKMLGFDKLIFAPRHIKRGKNIKEIAENLGYSSSLWSENNFDSQVIIVDIFGMLESLYINATKIFIGGSLKKIGGHNIYEALQFCKTVAVGKYVFSFQEIVDIAKEFNLIYEINDKKDALNWLAETDKDHDFENFFKKMDKMNNDAINMIIDAVETVMQ